MTADVSSCGTKLSKQSSSPLREALRRDGFVLVPGLLTEAQLLELRAAAATITDMGRRGRWPYIRTVPKQFPPWPKQPPPEEEEAGGIWGVQHLLHPAAPGRQAFANLYFSPVVLGKVREVLGLDEADDDDKDQQRLVMELFNLLVSPSGRRDFELRWHRDDVRPDVSVEEEARQLAEKSPDGTQVHAQYNIALYDDASLVVVPGSHRRVRTPVERSADPYAPELPGQITVTLRPGDGLFYDSNILHRGLYQGIDVGRETGRMTLHGSVGLVGHGKERATQVLQHGVGDWVHDAPLPLTGRQGKRAEQMRNNLLDMGRGDHVGFSLVG